MGVGKQAQRRRAQREGGPVQGERHSAAGQTGWHKGPWPLPLPTGVLLRAHLTPSLHPGGPGRILATATPLSPSQLGPAPHGASQHLLSRVAHTHLSPCLSHTPGVAARPQLLGGQQRPTPRPWPAQGIRLASVSHWWVWGTVGAGLPSSESQSPKDPEPVVGRCPDTPCPERRGRGLEQGPPDPALCSPLGVRPDAHSR